MQTQQEVLDELHNTLVRQCLLVRREPHGEVKLWVEVSLNPQFVYYVVTLNGDTDETFEDLDQAVDYVFNG